MKTRFALVLTVFVALSGNAQVLPNDAVVDGKTIGEWSAEWWKWVQLIPPAQNPVFDTNGSLANVGQPGGPVFLLSKGFNISRMGARTFSVEEDKHLFAPLITYFVNNVDVVPPLTLEQMRDDAKANIDLVISLHATIDGVPVPDLFNHRATSPPFFIDFASPDNLFSFDLGRPFTGLVDPIVAEGYYLMIQPLPLGTHVINFGATVGPPVNVIFDMTDTITIVPVPLPERVQRLIATLSASVLAQDRQQPLLVTLNAAKTSFDLENLRAGIKQLGAFQNKVRAQLGRTDSNLADQLIRAAHEIIDKAGRESKVR